MPIIQVNLFEGRTTEEKRKLVESMTDAVVKSLGVSPERVRITLNEMAKDNHAVGGILAIDWKEPK